MREPNDILDDYRSANFVSALQCEEYLIKSIQELEDYYYQKFQTDLQRRRSPSEE